MPQQGSDQKTADQLRKEIATLVGQYHQAAFPAKPFLGGISTLPVSGKVFDADEMQHLVDSSLDFWLTTGRFAEQFETQFAKVMGMKHALLCNSGSSANLLAVTALTSPRLKKRALKEGDEVITVAAGFPTTVNPILQNRLVPVFVDVQLGTYDATMESIEAAIGPKTKAIVMAHTLGNPFNLDGVMSIAKEHNLFVVEDTCDAVGATYNDKPVGSFGDISTTSFYPAHHITMGEGGCVLVKSAPMKKIVESLRDWGRDCWCPPGNDNTCGRRLTGSWVNYPMDMTISMCTHTSVTTSNSPTCKQQSALHNSRNFPTSSQPAGIISSVYMPVLKNLKKSLFSPRQLQSQTQVGLDSPSPFAPERHFPDSSWCNTSKAVASVPVSFSAATSCANLPISVCRIGSLAHSPMPTSLPTIPFGSVSTRALMTKWSTS